MPRIAIAFGTLLIIVGLAGYAFSGGASLTALIPSLIGVLIGLCGFAALNQRLLKHAMHAAAALALLALLGSARGIVGIVSWAGGSVPERPLAVASQSITAVICFVFLLLSVRYFIEARRAQANKA